MLDVDQRTLKERPSSLAQWAYRAIGQPGVFLRVRLRGNKLHILCESRQILDAQTVVNCLIKTLKGQEGEDSLPIDPENPIHQIIIYGRILGQERPEWIKQINIKPSRTSQVKAPKTFTDASFDAQKNKSSFAVSNENLARSVSLEEIAHYLTESISSLGVSVKVLIQNLPEASAKKAIETNPTSTEASVESDTTFQIDSDPSPPNRRLWVICNSDYSPDASLLTEPVVQQLRKLQLTGFRDAAICSQVRGEASPEWMLRVDLTPPEKMIEEWARWGDVQAIARILNQGILELGLEVRAVLKDVTLHLFCSLLEVEGTAVPDKPTAVSAIVPILDAIAPQGIQAATVYGVESHKRSLVPEQETPVWIEWLNLPAADEPRLAESAYSLAQQGNKEALTFLLQRLLNPDLDRRLATGGIQLKVRRKQDLLHIMCEAPICPPQSQIGPPIARFLRQLAIPKVAGARVYGRRAGSTSPLWNYGIDFAPRQRLVPEAPPEFAASDAYVNELVAPTAQPVVRPDLTKEDLQNGLNNLLQATVRTIQRWLCYSQLFVPSQENQELATVTQRSSSKSFSESLSLKVAIVWGMVGILLTIQADWLLGQMLHSQAQSTSGEGISDFRVQTAVSLPKVSLKKGGTQGAGNFNTSGFTRQGDTSILINEEANNALTAKRSSAATAAKLAAARSPNPSLNNQLLDEKLALYQQRVFQSGPPDVLIVGSSRALRGVDPKALQEALAAQGYRDVDVFNFAINGATAQVVDLLIRRVLTPEQLPKLIIWADGARAFNSGRADTTYDAIAASEGYQQLKAGTFSIVNGNRRLTHSGETASQTSGTNQTAQPFASLNASSQSINNWLNQSLGKVSSTYPQRDQLKSLLREQFVTVLQQTNILQAKDSKDSQLLLDEDAIDFDGFLPLSIRFNPASYYKQHPRVAGSYDKDYESFQLRGDQDNALESLVQFAKAHQMGIVFVNLPLTKDYLDPVRTEYEEQFQRYMRSSALDKGLIFLDLTQLLLTKNDYFSDPSHLNRYGADKVSHQLAKDPMIPWSLVIRP